MKNKFVSYDDNGIITIGTKQECLESIRDWSTTDEAEMIYNEDDLGNIYSFFNRKYEENTYISNYGFAVSTHDNMKRASSSPIVE